MKKEITVCPKCGYVQKPPFWAFCPLCGYTFPEGYDEFNYKVLELEEFANIMEKAFASKSKSQMPKKGGK